MNYWLAVSRAPFLDNAELEDGRLERIAKGVFQDAFQHIGDTFPVTAAILVCAGLLLLMAAAWGWQRHKQRHLRSEPMLTFHQVAGSMGLSLKQQWLLVRIARGEALPTPLTLMLSSATLTHHARRFAESTGTRRPSAIGDEVASIGRVLFGKSPATLPDQG